LYVLYYDLVTMLTCMYYTMTLWPCWLVCIILW